MRNKSAGMAGEHLMGKTIALLGENVESIFFQESLE